MCVCISLFYLSSVKKWRLVLFIDNRPKGCFVSGRFVPPDVLSPQTFCLHRCFVPTDVLSLRMFCPYGRFVPWTLCLRLFCLRTFCLRMFCPYGRFVSGRFVWAPGDRLEYEYLGKLVFKTILGYQSRVCWACFVEKKKQRLNLSCQCLFKEVSCYPGESFVIRRRGTSQKQVSRHDS